MAGSHINRLGQFTDGSMYWWDSFEFKTSMQRRGRKPVLHFRGGGKIKCAGSSKLVVRSKRSTLERLSCLPLLV